MKEILVNRSHEETRVAMIEDGKLFDLFVERRETEKIVGNIYKGKVVSVLPGISGAFADIGLEKNAYLYVDDVLSGKNERRKKDGKERKIEKMLRRGQEIMVQIDKEPISTKGAKTTMDVSLPGRLLVYMPFSDSIGISRNIEKREERNRLRDIIQSVRPDEGGFIIRTEAEDASEAEIKREVKYLARIWNSISQRAKKVKSPNLLHRDFGVVFQTVRDFFNEDVKIMMIDNRSEYKEVREFVKIISPDLVDRVHHYTAKTPMYKAFKLEDEIKKLKSNRVLLPSGGSIIIQEAESLCAIDVNTGRFTGKGQTQEETVTITNVEAAKEIARQLRLRNIGGIVVIDFIDMKRVKNRNKVMDALRKAVKNDKAKIKILPITRLGLIEMTRERKRESFLSLMGETCPECHGTGQVISRESLFIQISNELNHLKVLHHPGSIKIRLHPDVAGYFKERISRLAKVAGDKIDIQKSRDIQWDDFQLIIE